MNHIEHTGYTLPADQLIKDWQSVSSICNVNQVNLRKPAYVEDHVALLFGAGSLYKDGNWTEYIDMFSHLYTVRVAGKLLEQIAAEYDGKIGRLRYMVMEPKSCLTYHTDPDDIMRLHIPIITSEGAMFINDRQVDVMQHVGAVYKFNSTVKHTAINASRERRVHLVASVYKPIILEIK
jgi:hypothetical protein